MNKKKVFTIAAIVLIALVGFYLVFTSDIVQVDLFTIVLFLLVFALIIYFYLIRLGPDE